MAHIRPAAPPPRMTASNAWVTVDRVPQGESPALFLYRRRDAESPLHASLLLRELHVKQAQARQSVFFQQAFVNILLLQLVDLHAGHFAAVESKIAVGVRTNGDDFLVRCRGEQRREKLFFQHRESSLQVFQT